MKRLILLVILAVTVLLTGCAHMSKEECQTADWRTIGMEDGSRGQPVSSLGRHRRVCAKAGVAPDLDAYTRGHKEGLKAFCTPQKGYQYASSGGTYTGVCAGPFEKGFLTGYEEGRLLFSVNRDLANAKSALNEALEHIDAVNHDIEHNRSLIISEESTAVERVEGLTAIKSLTEELTVLEADVPVLEQTVFELEQEYRNIRRIHEGKGYYR